MKATGVTRKLDELGRIVVPKELRRTLGIEHGDSIEFFTDNDGSIVLRKYQPGCRICGSMDNLFVVQGERICRGCGWDIIEAMEKMKQAEVERV